MPWRLQKLLQTEVGAGLTNSFVIVTVISEREHGSVVSSCISFTPLARFGIVSLHKRKNTQNCCGK